MDVMKALAVIIPALISYISAIEISDFQPAIVPIRSVTTLNVATTGQLNASSTIQCRFNDISMPAEFKDSMVFCKTPPMRQTDKAVLHLEVDGKLFKAKKQLRLHEPFKVTDIFPKTASPSEQLAIKVSGITCEEWMAFFVRFQTSNGTKRTTKGICNNSTVTCFIPEFPVHALLRIGVTLSNRIVEWSPTKLRIQYPVDSMKSSLKDLKPNIKQSGALTLKIVLRDKFQNPVSVPGPSGSNSPVSIQYSPSTHPKNFHFLNCEVSLITDGVGSAYTVGCHGAKHEKILIYPSINNVPVGGTDSYEVRTTLCPGKSSCDDNSALIIIVSCSLGTILIVVLGVLLYRYRNRFHRKFKVRDGSHRDATSMELNEYQGNRMALNPSIEDLPELHANESVISGGEPPDQSDHTISQDLLENGPEHHLKRENKEAEGMTLSPVENAAGGNVNVALSTDNREDNNEAKSESEVNKSTHNHSPFSNTDLDKHVGLAKEVILEDLELQEMEMSTADYDLDNKL